VSGTSTAHTVAYVDLYRSALDSSRSHLVAAAHDIELRSFDVADQVWRVLHSMNVGTRVTRSSFVGAIHQTNQFAEFYDDRRDHPGMVNRHHARRPEAIECAVKIYSLLHALNQHDIEALSNGCDVIVSTGHTL
jgi:hypothetical protein